MSLKVPTLPDPLAREEKVSSEILCPQFLAPEFDSVVFYSLDCICFPAATEVGTKRGTYKTHASTDLIQVAGNEGQVQDSKQ